MYLQYFLCNQSLSLGTLFKKMELRLIHKPKIRFFFFLFFGEIPNVTGRTRNSSFLLKM